jgi:heptaprenyl diphosphate synthase
MATHFAKVPGMNSAMASVEDALRDAVRVGDPYLGKIASHLIVAGGKRLRPAMAIAAGSVWGGGASTEVVRAAAACELVHIGSLYHDDVMDESPQRRGVATVHAEWGNLQAIVAGDFLLARASAIAASLGSHPASILAHTIGKLCEGQIAEVRDIYRTERSVDDYMASIGGKTASLFAAAAELGAVVAGADESHIEAARAVGEAYGMVFQIVDDVLDLTSTAERLGKPTGHDIKEGVYTLPVLLVLHDVYPGGEQLRAILGPDMGEDLVSKALRIVSRSGAIEESKHMAREWANRSRDAVGAARTLGAGAVLGDAAAALLVSLD